MVEIKKRKLTVIGNSSGFLVPSAYHKDKMISGLVIGQYYDLKITEAFDGETTSEHND